MQKTATRPRGRPPGTGKNQRAAAAAAAAPLIFQGVDLEVNPPPNNHAKEIGLPGRCQQILAMLSDMQESVIKIMLFGKNPVDKSDQMLISVDSMLGQIQERVSFLSVMIKKIAEK